MSSILKVDTIQDQNGNLIISKDSGGGGFLSPYASSTAPIVYTVTVATKTTAHPYSGVGSSNAYFINGIEAPIIELKGNDTAKPYYYKFDQSDASNGNGGGHPLRFYVDAAKTTQFTTGVTTSGTPGQAGAHTTIAVDKDTPSILYYQCSSHAHMGNHTIHNSPTINTGAFLKLPVTDGTNGQAIITNGSGTLSFSTVEETKPTVANVSQTIAPATATTINITGTNFVSIPRVEFIKTDGSVTNANTVGFTSATSLSVNVTLALGNYFVRVENPNGMAGRSTNNILTASTAPTWTTNAGSLGTIAGNFSGTVATVAATSDSTVAYSETTNVLTNASQANCTLNSSTGVITTSDFGGSSTSALTYTFTLRATDAEGQTADRVFTLTSSFGATGGAQFN